MLEELLKLRQMGLTLSDILALAHFRENGLQPVADVAGTLRVSINSVYSSWQRLRHLGLMPSTSVCPAPPHGMGKVGTVEKAHWSEWSDRRITRFRAVQKQNQMRKRAAAGGYPCTITTEQIEALLASARTCPACGSTLDHSRKPGKNRRLSPSIDRINPAEGYVIGNVAILCFRCNVLKRDASAGELQMVTDWVKSVRA